MDRKISNHAAGFSDVFTCELAKRLSRFDLLGAVEVGFAARVFAMCIVALCDLVTTSSKQNCVVSRIFSTPLST